MASKKQLILERIKVAFAEGDRKTGIRLYCENRISRADFDKAAAVGDKIYFQRKAESNEN